MCRDRSPVKVPVIAALLRRAETSERDRDIQTRPQSLHSSGMHVMENESSCRTDSGG